MTNEYLRLLASFEVALPLERPSRLAEVKLARKILDLSEGTIGEISALLTCAALAAIERGTERITSSVLDGCGYVVPRERRRCPAELGPEGWAARKGSLETPNQRPVP
jgi:hypothetical protein